MGQGSSQPLNGGLSEPENQGHNAVGYSPSGPPKISKKAKSELQVEGTPAPKRKRKQTVNDTNIPMPSDTPNQSQESPLDQEGARPVKRTKIAPSTANTKEARKPEKNGSREAIPLPRTPVITNISETGKVQRQSMDMQPLTVVVHTNGTSTKKPKKSKAKTTQQDEEKEVPALPQSPAETKTVSMASADPSLADSSTDQKDSTDTPAARGPRKGKKDKMIGFFAASEVRALETFKLRFCNEHGISSERFDRMVQHVDRRKDSGWPIDENIIKKPDFWQLIYDVLPSRDRRSVYRFMKRHFQDSSQKPHHWTHEQDDELIDLVGQYGPKFAHIAKMIGRVEDDVVQRWKNRLEHRSTMRRGAWSEEEVRGLLDALQDSWNKLKKDGQNVGRDIYEMDEGLISWGTVSNKLQNWRSRQQCADKWRKIRRKIMGKRSTGDQEAVYDPAWDAKPQGRAKSITLAEQMEMERMLFKSSEYVDSEDGDEEDMEQSAGTETQSPKVKDEGESAEEKPTIIAAPEKPAATPAKALNKVSQYNELQTEIDDDSESEASSDSADSASDDASEAETKSGSGSGSDSDSDSESSVESDAELDARMSAQSSKREEKDERNNKASSAKTSKPTKSTPNQKLADRSTPETSDDRQSRGQATKTSASDSLVKAETNAIAQSKASKPSKSTIKEEETPQATSSESESESASDSSSDSEAESTSTSDEPSNRQPTKVAPKAPTSILKASVKGQATQQTQNSSESEESSSTSDETSSGDDSTEDSETSGDSDSESDSDSDSDSDSSASDDKPVKSPKAAALEGTKRKAQEPPEQTGNSASKRLKTGEKPNKKSSSPSSSDTSSSEDNESEDESDSHRGSNDSDSEVDTDESSSASDSSDSSSKPQAKSKSESKHPTAQPKVPNAVTGQSIELPKSRAPAISKDGSNAQNGQSGPKKKSKQVKPSFSQVKTDGEKEKVKWGSTPLPKGKKSN